MRAVAQENYTKEYFEQDCGGHEEWEKSRGAQLTPRLAYVKKLAKIKSGMKVLDWGCGRGELVYQAAKEGADVLGLDYAEEALKLARAIPYAVKGKMELKKVKSLKIPAKDRSYDLVLFVDVIEHLYPAQVRKILAEFARVLKPGGRVIVHTFPNLDYYDQGYRCWTRWWHKLANPVWQLFFREKLRSESNPRFGYDEKVHVNECSLPMVKRFLEKAGLKTKAWYDSRWRIIRLRDRIRYGLFQPIWFSQRLFADDIFAVGRKEDG